MKLVLRSSHRTPFSVGDAPTVPWRKYRPRVCVHNWNQRHIFLKQVPIHYEMRPSSTTYGDGNCPQGVGGIHTGGRQLHCQIRFGSWRALGPTLPSLCSAYKATKGQTQIPQPFRNDMSIWISHATDWHSNQEGRLVTVTSPRQLLCESRYPHGSCALRLPTPLLTTKTLSKNLFASNFTVVCGLYAPQSRLESTLEISFSKITAIAG